ncbi:MAG: ABC transporter ATP-binding protein, partial [Candidatus Eremiobacteraeota bacterium]|nr:ABC transporter ATP-binding protein [Candidatus Eremiobacteraeota bacterium]
KEEFWALKNVSVEVQQGEIIGILGKNGAGKSTFLKVLSRITEPSMGRIHLNGRVASLLEVGTGFHPELTGRENVFLNGAILGMSREEIKMKFDEIVAFAEIEKFLDTPVKRYSSGMYVRLAFSVAAHLDPEILIVDEVLAVGDVAFQRKCLGKMEDANTRSRTVLFVSHNLAAVESFCSRAIVLEQGQVVFDGPSQDAIQFYLESLRSNGGGLHSDVIDLHSAPGRPAKYRPQLKKLALFDGNGQPLRGNLPAGGSLKALIYFELENPCPNVDAELGFYTLGGERICTAHSAYEPCRQHKRRVGDQLFVCEIPNLPLLPGEYKINVRLDIALCEVDSVEDATRLTVIQSDFYGTGILPTKGVFLMNNRWTMDHDREEVAA